MADPTDDRGERDARFLAFCEQAGDPGGSMLAAGHAYLPRKESETTMTDPTDETLTDDRLRHLARHWPTEMRAVAAELLRLREAQRAADELAEAVDEDALGESGECMLCSGGGLFDDRGLHAHEPTCPLTAYRAARGER